MLYLDTSALLPYYRHEARSHEVQELLLTRSAPVLVSDLTRLEVASAVARWVRMGEIEEADAERIGRAFDDDVDAGRYELKRNTRAHVELARRWLLARMTPVRTLDALHLACAATEDASLVTFDETLRDAAVRLGVRVLEI